MMKGPRRAKVALQIQPVAMFNLGFKPEALDELNGLRKRDRQRIVDAIETQLPNQADRQTRNRKRLRPNDLASWEMRVGDSRVFYNIDTENDVVEIVAVGVKRGNKLFIGGEEYTL
jgi:mRNA-degrading endonuclease RelE of RelBE toxin-antitoxin system